MRYRDGEKEKGEGTRAAERNARRRFKAVLLVILAAAVLTILAVGLHGKRQDVHTAGLHGVGEQTSWHREDGTLAMCREVKPNGTIIARYYRADGRTLMEYEAVYPDGTRRHIRYREDGVTPESRSEMRSDGSCLNTEYHEDGTTEIFELDASGKLIRAIKEAAGDAA